MESLTPSPVVDVAQAVARVRPARGPLPGRGGYRGRVYEDDLDADPRWAMSEGGRFFEGESRVHQALLKIARKLTELEVPYCIVGGMALFEHGYRRFTDDIDILVPKDGLRKIHAKLSGLGYLPPFERSKNLRDTELGVRIEFLVAGEYPGDGRPKPVAFPDPGTVGIERDGIRYLDLPKLVELKLASGISQPDRMKDLSDVYELIKILDLPEAFGERIDPFVRPKFAELWRDSRRRYKAIWRNKWPAAEAKTLDEMIVRLREAADELEAMRKDGVTLDPAGGTADDYAILVTSDPAIAKKYDMHDESEFWDDDEEVESAS